MATILIHLQTFVVRTVANFKLIYLQWKLQPFIRDHAIGRRPMRQATNVTIPQLHRHLSKIFTAASVIPMDATLQRITDRSPYSSLFQ